MSKTKSTSKSSKSAKSDDILTKVKDAAITKPAQTIKAKSQELAKVIAGKEDKKDKKSKKKAKEPTPEPSESEESESSESSESENETENTKKSSSKGQPKKAAAKAESSDDSDSDSDASEAEAPKANGSSKKAESDHTKAKPQESSDESDESGNDSDASMADATKAQAQADVDSDNDSSEQSSDDEKPTKKATSNAAEVKKAKKNESESEDDSDADSESSEDSDEEKEEAAPNPSKRKAEAGTDQSAKKSKTEAVDTSRGGNLFVGNLSWNVDEAWLREVFEEYGELSGVRIMTDRDSGRSKGFGYVEFVNAEDAAKAHSAKAGADLDGRALNVDFANPRPDNSQKQENRRKSYGDQVSEPSDTLFVGNLSFEVGQETVTEAFAPHGQILGIRLPTDRETGNPKGFGYVTFASAEEAKGALEAMQGAYIEGRPVRLDYSSPRPQNNDSPARGRGGFGGRGGGRGGARGGRGGRGGNFGGRGGRGGSRGGSTNRGGFGDFSGRKTSFD